MWADVIRAVGDTVQIHQTQPQGGAIRFYERCLEGDYLFIEGLDYREFGRYWLDSLVYGTIAVFTEPVALRTPGGIRPDGIIFNEGMIAPFALGLCPSCNEHTMPLPLATPALTMRLWDSVNSVVVARAIDGVYRGRTEQTVFREQSSWFGGAWVSCDDFKNRAP